MKHKFCIAVITILFLNIKLVWSQENADKKPCTIVVLGSSTAAGTGASSPDSTWVNRYRNYLGQNYEVINLAYGGYTTYQFLPTGTTMPGGIDEFIDKNRNINKALSYNPFAVIINLSSNDANKQYGVYQQLNNLKKIIDLANNSDVLVFITTAQPRNFSNPVQLQIQLDFTNSIRSVFGVKAIDFWKDIADANGFIKPLYNSGDGIHLNDAGHRKLYERVCEKLLDTVACTELNNEVKDVMILGNIAKIYPNPFFEKFTLEIESGSYGEIKLQLYDFSGRTIFYQTDEITYAGIQTISVDRSQITSDNSLIYGIVTLTDENGITSYSFNLVMSGK